MSFFTPTILSEIIRQLVLNYFPLTSEVSVLNKSIFNLQVKFLVLQFLVSCSLVGWPGFTQIRYAGHVIGIKMPQRVAHSHQNSPSLP